LLPLPHRQPNIAFSSPKGAIRRLGGSQLPKSWLCPQSKQEALQTKYAPGESRTRFFSTEAVTLNT
jgi:hypothetical protein